MDPLIVPSFDNPQALIQKRLITPGKGDLTKYPDGTKMSFNYVTRLCDDEHTVIDDSKKHSFQMELILGKKFKLEVWETCIKSMKPGEVASFTVDKALLGGYPVVASSLRNIQHGKKGEHKHHTCGFSLREKGVGYPDLDKLLKDPQPLEFIFEMLKVEVPGEYKKESWAMSVEEQTATIPKLKEEGNALFKEKKYEEASKRYAEAIGILESLMTREKPGDEEYCQLEAQRRPFLLNYSQCLLFMGDYYPVIDHTTEVLKTDPDNVKALFRRAKAHVGAWNPKEAKEDFQRAAELDSSLANAVKKEIATIVQMEKQRDKEDKEKLGGKIF